MHARRRQIETDEHRGNLTNASRANKRILIDLHEANCRLYLLTYKVKDFSLTYLYC